MRTRYGRIAAVAAALLSLGACQMASPPQPNFPDLTFAHLPKLRLDVAQIEVIDEYVSPAKPPNVEHLFPTRPAAVAERWGRDRLEAVGAAGRARVLVKRASVVEVPLEQSKGIRGLLTTDQSERYDAVIEIVVQVEGPKGRGSVASSATRSRSVPENVSLNDRERMWFEMTEEMMSDLNTALEARIREAFANYLR